MAKLHTVHPYPGELQFIGVEPTWNGVGDKPRQVTPENYKHEMGRGLNWHHDAANKEDLFKYIEEWIREYRPAATLEDDLLLWKRVSKAAPLLGTYPSLARMQLQGFEISPEYSDRIWNFVLETVKLYPKESTTSDEPRASVQDYIREQIEPTWQEIHHAIDELIEGRQVKFPTVENPKFKEAHYKIIVKLLDESLTAWEKIPKMKRISGIITVARDEVLALAKKSKKIRAKAYKPLDPKKLVKKLKYLKAFEGVASIAPVDMIGANVVWVYDTVKRKIGYYKSETDASITVKGTTVLGIKDSVQKILRKPEEQLKEFVKLKKNQAKGWFDEIKAVEQELNGRTNDNLLILRAD